MYTATKQPFAVHSAAQILILSRQPSCLHVINSVHCLVPGLRKDAQCSVEIAVILCGELLPVGTMKDVDNKSIHIYNRNSFLPSFELGIETVAIQEKSCQHWQKCTETQRCGLVRLQESSRTHPTTTHYNEIFPSSPEIHHNRQCRHDHEQHNSVNANHAEHSVFFFGLWDHHLNFGRQPNV